MYKILASDGNEYDSISADKIRQWIREGRVEAKTPVMPEGAEDWVFLGDLPEFKELFSAQKKRQDKAARKGKRSWALVISIAVIVVAAAALILLFVL